MKPFSAFWQDLLNGTSLTALLRELGGSARPRPELLSGWRRLLR